MSSRTSLFIVLAILLSGAGAIPVEADVINGDFAGGPTGWSFAGNVGIFDSASYRSCCASGDTGTGKFAAFGGNDGPNDGQISQVFATSAGSTYLLDFDYGAFSSPSGVGTQSLNILAGNLDAQIVSSLSQRDLSGVLNAYEFLLVADGPATTLTFRDSSGANTRSIDGFLDNVRVAAVPGPTTIALFGTALFGMRAFRRRQSGKPRSLTA